MSHLELSWTTQFQPGRESLAFFSFVHIVICAGQKSAIKPPLQARNAAAIEAAFKDHEIIPDLLSGAPKYALEVTFQEDNYVDFGNYIVPEVWSQQPTKVHFPQAHKDRMYVLIMTGLDFPTRERPNGREWWYWVDGDLLGGPGAKGKKVMAYMGPDEMKINSGVHRIVFLLMEQLDGRIWYEDKHLMRVCNEARRSCRNTTEFMKKYNLTAPVAGNFFTSGYKKS